MKLAKLCLILSAAVLLTALSPCADAATNKAAGQVNRTLSRLNDKRDTQLRDNSRRARTERTQRAREQAQPGHSQNRTRKQAEDTRNRLDTIQDKQTDMRNARERDAAQKKAQQEEQKKAQEEKKKS